MSSENAGLTVELPCGWMDKEGKVHKDAEIIPMTGRVREALARKEIRGNPAKITDVILLSCLKRVGTIENINNPFLGDLLIADRDFLVLEIRKLSMGDIVTANIECPSCNEKLDVKFDLTDIKSEKLDDKVQMLDGERVFSVRDVSLGVNALFRFPKGRDQAAMIPLMEKNPVQAAYTLYAACLLELNGEKPVAEKPGEKAAFDRSVFTNMPVKQLDFLDEGFTAAMPGPDMKQTVSCPSCTSDIAMSFESSDFLFRRPKHGTK